MTASEMIDQPFGTVSAMIAQQAIERPGQPALLDQGRTLSFHDFDALIDRCAAALQREGVIKGKTVAICGVTSLEYVVAFFATVRVGAVACPLSPSSTPEAFAAMLRDAAPQVLFADESAKAGLVAALSERETPPVVALDETFAPGFEQWIAEPGARPRAVEVAPSDPFNIIYSSGTTGSPKGIVQPHQMRWGHVKRGIYEAGAVTLVSTPLYSNTTLVSIIPALSRGGTVILMRKFDARQFLELAQHHKVTHAMLVPVQYRRIMDLPDFERFDLSSFRMKTCTSAPFAAELKADVLKRWPGGLTEFFGMTEGGGTCVLEAHLFPDKLHTVGRPADGHDIRIIDDDGLEAPPGALGEIVGRSGAMMLGYNNQPEKTRETEWLSPEGLRFIRTGDVGRFDEDGFLVLGDRKKDMIISGGFNIYPSDLEAEMLKHPQVVECAVVGAPSREWGETPAAFVVMRSDSVATEDDVKTWVNSRLGKMQRISAVRFVEALPRSPIGKVLKRELRDRFTNGVQS